MIKALIFDFFGVFTADSWRLFCEELPKEADVARAKELNHLLDAGLIDYQEFLSGVQAATGADAARIARALQGGETIDQRLIEYIRQLKPKYKIAILSNVGSNQIRERHLSPEEQSLIDAFIFSYEIGITKPDRRIYEIALEKLEVSPGEAVFTDDRQSNVAVAETLGIKGIYYTGFPAFKAELQRLLNL